MKIVSRLTPVFAAMILAAGCRSSQEHASSNQNYGPVYVAASSYQNSSTTSSSTTSGDHSLTSGSFQTTAANTGHSGLTESDRTLSRQVQQQLQNDPTLAAAAPNIHVTAQNGTVILSGNVKSDQDKENIESTVRSMSGVVSVNNQLQVSLQPTSEPASKSSRIYSEPPSQSSSIKSDSASQTSVSSSESDTKEQPPAATTDKPTQGSAAADQTQGAKDKQLSPTSDKADDTTRVYSKDPNESASSSSSSQTFDTSRIHVQAATDADGAIGQQVMSSIRTEASLATAPLMLMVRVDNGKVTLRGTVKSEQEKQNIEAAAQKVSGVTSVDNQLKVGSPEQNDPTDHATDSTTTPDTQ